MAASLTHAMHTVRHCQLDLTVRLTSNLTCSIHMSDLLGICGGMQILQRRSELGMSIPRLLYTVPVGQNPTGVSSLSNFCNFPHNCIYVIDCMSSSSAFLVPTSRGSVAPSLYLLSWLSWMHLRARALSTGPSCFLHQYIKQNLERWHQHTPQKFTGHLHSRGPPVGLLPTANSKCEMQFSQQLSCPGACFFQCLQDLNCFSCAFKLLMTFAVDIQAQQYR